MDRLRISQQELLLATERVIDGMAQSLCRQQQSIMSTRIQVDVSIQVVGPIFFTAAAIGMRAQLQSRSYRLKFPDDVQDELGNYYAPLWFGAEVCFGLHVAFHWP